jgi:predicted O-methyltransferase YrrM
LAELEIARAGYGDRIRVICGQAADLLPGLSGPYDLIFSNADPEEIAIVIARR